MSEARKRYDTGRERYRAESVNARRQASERSENAKPEEVVYSEVTGREGRTVGQRILGFIRSLFVVLFVLGFVGACIFQSYQLEKEGRALDAQMEQIREEIAVEKAKVLEYRVDKAYYESDQYKEDMARNRFRLIYPGEILIQITN